MKRKIRVLGIFLTVLGFAALILDAKTALVGAKDGLQLCIETVLPSLFPFVFISTILNGYITGTEIKLLRPLTKLCNIPAGAESLLLVGFLGGYPVGAQCVNADYCEGKITKSDAERILGFCNNAGPSFIFGMVGSLFQSSVTVWLIWIIQILSAVIVGCILPSKAASASRTVERKTILVSKVLEKSLKTMACICGWVVLFRVLISIADRWILWLFPPVFRLGIIGSLELTNGIHSLMQIPSEGIRFIFASSFLSIGGICVTLQTASVTSCVGLGKYFPGKLLQFSISLLISSVIQMYIFEFPDRCLLPWWIYVIPVLLLMTSVYVCKRKNYSSFCRSNAV